MYVYIYGLLCTCHLFCSCSFPPVDNLYQIFLPQWWILLHQQCSSCRRNYLWQQEGKVFIFCLSVCLFICLSVCQSVCLSACLSVCLPVSLSLYMYVQTSTCMYHVSMCVNVYSSLMSVHGGCISEYLVTYFLLSLSVLIHFFYNKNCSFRLHYKRKIFLSLMGCTYCTIKILLNVRISRNMQFQ